MSLKLNDIHPIFQNKNFTSIYVYSLRLLNQYTSLYKLYKYECKRQLNISHKLLPTLKTEMLEYIYTKYINIIYKICMCS